MTVLIACVVTVICALSMLIVRHPMRMAISLVSTMVCLALIYGLLGNYVLAVAQILIYVGAVMVFMIYVIMLFDVHDSSLKRPFSPYLFPAILFIIVSCLFIFPKIKSKVMAPITPQSVHFDYFAKHFLDEYWFHFELASVLLLVATISAVTILKRENK